MKNFNYRIVELRQEKNVSQNVVAAATGVALRSYQRYEAGERDIPGATLIALADFFGVSLDYLVGRTDKPEVNK